MNRMIVVEMLLHGVFWKSQVAVFANDARDDCLSSKVFSDGRCDVVSKFVHLSFLIE